MRGADGAPRPAWRAFAEAWFGMTEAARAGLAEDARRRLEEAGLAYDPHVEGRRQGVGWRFDPAPLLISGEDWATLEAAVIQRARLMERALDDLYGPQSLIASGALPPALAFGGADFLREAARWERPPRRRLTRFALDVTRTEDGRWVALDDVADRPDGQGWALANRVALAQAAPDLFVEAGARRLAGHFGALREALEADAGADGRIALLTPGPGDPAYFSHAYLARFLGLTLVEPGDLAVRDGEARIKTLEGLKRLDVVLRATPSTGADPLYAPGAGGGAAPPGLLRAARLGRIVIANGLGAGALEGRALATVSARLCRDLLGEAPRIEEAPCLWLGDAAARERWAAAPEAWDATPLRAAPRPGAAPPDTLDLSDPDAARRRMAREGWGWVARAPVRTTAAPVARAGGLGAAAWAMRLFAVAGPEGWRVMPGALALTAPGETVTALPVFGSAKDVWVLAEQPAPGIGASALLSRQRRTAHLRRTGRDLLSRVADNLFWLGRNAERAEFTLRVLRAVIERMVDAPRPDRAPALLHALLSLRLAGPPESDGLAEARARAARLALDPAEPAALGPLLDSLYWSADATRAHLSRDAWRDVSALAADPVWRAAPDPTRVLALAGPVEDAIRSLGAFAGATHENMTRNFAWRFLELGKRLERAVSTVAMFRALIGAARHDESARLHALLELCDSYFAYRARYMTTPEATPAIDLLILDESNPRSLAFQIARMEEALADLPRATPYRNPEHRATLALLTALRVAEAGPLGEADPEGRRAALTELLDEAARTLTAVSDQIAKAWFAHAEPVLTEIMAARGAPR